MTAAEIIVGLEAKLDELDARLAEQSAKLQELARVIRYMSPVYEAAKRYVTSPYVEPDEHELAAQLERAVTAAIAKEQTCQRTT